jgi:hypothetical protein
MPIQTLYAARNIDFAPTLNFDYRGGPLPLAGATISMQVRLYPGAAGAPLAADAAAVFTDALHPDFEPDMLDELRRLTVEPEIKKTALAALPGQNTPDPGDPQTFAYEIKITYADNMQDSLLSGEFILSAGVDAT